MNKLQYNIHLCLNNEYYLIYKLILLLLLYILIFNKDFVLCMNEETNAIEAPQIAEAKEDIRPNHQVLALKNEIMKFAGTYTELTTIINKQTKLIIEQESKIEELLTDIEGPKDHFFSPLGYKGQIIQLSNEIGTLEEEILNLKQQLTELEADKK